jgi:hypothetical protein
MYVTSTTNFVYSIVLKNSYSVPEILKYSKIIPALKITAKSKVQEVETKLQVFLTLVRERSEPLSL